MNSAFAASGANRLKMVMNNPDLWLSSLSGF
jgi:hypothetical protein